jgi:hypothetical protein
MHMRKFNPIILLSLILFLPSLLLAESVKTTTDTPEKNSLAVFYTLQGDVQEPFNHIVEHELKNIGFNITDPHKRVNDQYKKKYGSTILDVLSFMSIVNDQEVMPLLNIDPRIAGFSPFNMLIHKKLDENVTHIGHLMPTAILDILDIKDSTVRESFTASFEPLDKKLEAAFKAKGLKFTKSYRPYKKLAQKRMMNFEYEFEAPEDMEDFIDEFQNRFELAFIDKQYLIAGYHNFMESTDDAEDILESYDAFWTYSLCHLEYSYNMFDNKGAHPEAGLFAPCSMYMYIKKGTNKLVVGMPTLVNWSDTLGITDEKRVGLVQQLDKEIPAILTEIGMKSVPNVNPLTRVETPKAPTANVAITEAQSKTEVAISTIPEDTLAIFYTIEDNNVEKIYNKIIEEDLKSIDFMVTDPHHRVNDQYKKKYGSTVLDLLSFLSVANDKVVLPLLNIDPRIASTAPFNMLIHKKLNEKATHVGHLVPKVFLDMIGIKDKKVRDIFTASFHPLDKKLEAAFKANGLKYTKSYLPYKKLPEQRMMNFEYEFEAPEDMEDFIDEFQNRFELAFIDKQYLIAGYHNFMESTDDAEDILESYDAFWTYSLCHLEFSYNMFDNKGAQPNAGLFAPCSMYMYIKKGSNKLVVGMLRLHNWSNTLGINDDTRVGLIKKLDAEIPEILTSLGMKAIPNVNPLTLTTSVTVRKEMVKTKAVIKKEAKTTKTKIAAPIAKKVEVDKIETKSKTQTIESGGKTIHIIIPKPPKVPSVIKIKTTNSSYTGDGGTRSIKFSKRIPPNYVPSSERTKNAKPQNTSTNIGEVINGKISAYLRGKYMDVKTAKDKLKEAGFEVITVTPVNKKGDLISIVFTDKALVKIASKPNRGFIASLRLLVNKKDNHISITNPLYLSKAFMQEDYDEETAKNTLTKITSVFTDLLNSKDMLKFQLLPKYQFMNGMPHYQDMTIVARGNDLLKKIKNNKKVLFTQKLENGAILIGVKLGKRTSKFTDRIGTNNAALLPYPILIENGEAKIMEPKYYISVMYPLLQMSEFMTIATIPGAIIKDCEKVFK